MNQDNAPNSFQKLDEIHNRITDVNLQIQELFQLTYNPQKTPIHEHKISKLKMVTNELKELEVKINNFENELKTTLPNTH